MVVHHWSTGTGFAKKEEEELDSRFKSILPLMSKFYHVKISLRGKMDSFGSNATSPSSRGSKTVWNVSEASYTVHDSRLPEEWQNDERMGFLFAPFYPRDTNPNGYDAKMKFWTEMLQLWCSECGRATFSISLLQKSFRRKNVSPACLQIFIEELEKKGDLMKEEQYTSWDRTESWTAWAVKTVVKKPAVWSFAKLKETLISTDPSQVTYVSIAHLKTVGDRLTQNVGNNDDSNVMTFGNFKELVGVDAEHVLRWLKNHGMATEVFVSEERWIKIGKGPLVEIEVTKHKLREEITRLHETVDQLEENIALLVENARINLQNNKRETAKRCLKQKKLIENRIKQTSQLADNLEELLSSLLDTENNAEILNVFQLGVKSLKAAHSGLSEDVVANTMTELEDVLEMSQDVTRAMRLAGDAGDDELEAELESIVTTCPALSSKSPSLPDLPDVPACDPSPKREVSGRKSPTIMSPS